MLFVDHDQAQPRQRRKHAHAGAQHDVSPAQMRQQPVAQPLHRRQPAVQRGQPVLWEARSKAGLQLRREVDLGHQHQGLPACGQHLLGGMQVDLGLAAAGDTVQQQRCRAWRGIGLGECSVEGRQRCLLLWPQLRALHQHGRRWGCGVQLLQQPGQALGQTGGVQLAKLRRQHGQRQLPHAALVVAGGKVDQRQPGWRHRRQAAEHRTHRAQHRRCVLRRRSLTHGCSGRHRAMPDDAQQLPSAQRHTQQGAGRPVVIAAVVQRACQAAVLGGLHGHGQGHVCQTD